jgi:hypothetical protein
MIVHMMQNMDLPVSPEQWPTVTEYLIKGVPEKPKPAAVVVPGPVEAAITEWPVPTLGSRPHDPFASIERRNLVHGTNCEPPWNQLEQGFACALGTRSARGTIVVRLSGDPAEKRRARSGSEFYRLRHAGGAKRRQRGRA